MVAIFVETPSPYGSKRRCFDTSNNKSSRFSFVLHVLYDLLSEELLYIYIIYTMVTIYLRGSYTGTEQISGSAQYLTPSVRNLGYVASFLFHAWCSHSTYLTPSVRNLGQPPSYSMLGAASGGENGLILSLRTVSIQIQKMQFGPVTSLYPSNNVGCMQVEVLGLVVASLSPPQHKNKHTI